MKIGALAMATQTPVETIRYYEREGLLPPPQRSSSNYREYEAQHNQLTARHNLSALADPALGTP